MAKENPFIKILKRPKRDRPILDFALTTSEVIGDTIIRGDVLEAIPLVNLAFKAVKAKDSVSDSIYAAKLVGFINGVGELTSEEREKASEQLLGEDAAKAGETVLLILDRITDLDKPELLGFLFKSFAIGRLTSEQMRRLSVAVDVAFGDDLRDLLDNNTKLADVEMQDCRRRLFSTGLTFIHIASGFGIAGESSYHLTELGILFYTLVNGEPPKDKIQHAGQRVSG